MGILRFFNKITGGIFNHFLFWAVVFGIVLFILGYGGFAWIPEFWENLAKVGASIVLSGGVFIFLAKSYQFTNIFKDELRHVIYCTEHLELRKDLDSLWVIVTEALCKQKFSLINKKLLKTIKEYYLPVSQDYYYKDYYSDVDIEHDPENPGYIILNEETKVTVVVENRNGCEYTFFSETPFSKDDNRKTFYKLEEFTINGQKIDIENQKLLKQSYSPTTLSVNFNYLCKAKIREFKIVRKEKRRYSLAANPYRTHKAICLYNNFTLDLTYPKDMDFHWIDLGVLGTWDHTRKDINTANRIKASYNGLIFRNQGFLLIYR